MQPSPPPPSESPPPHEVSIEIEKICLRFIAMHEIETYLKVAKAQRANW